MSKNKAKKKGQQTQGNLPDKKIGRMEAELQRNPNNNKTAQRLAELKRMHHDKLYKK